MEEPDVSEPVKLVLGSKSPARLQVLRGAGIEPIVVVSNVDEDAVTATLAPGAPAEEVVVALALAKAQSVADEVVGDLNATNRFDVAGRYLVLGADSMLFINDQLVGKPHSASIARERIAQMRGTDGVLWTGHALIPVNAPERENTEPGNRRWVVGDAVTATASTIVHFGDISDREIEAYVATGEPLNVAGAFTIDGLGGPFIRGVSGDPHSVIGVSLPLLRDLASDLGVFWPDLWGRARD